MEKNLVIGTATKLTEHDIENFIKSFRKHNTQADIALIILPQQIPELKNFFKKYNVKPLIFESRKLAKTTIINTRYIKYLDYITENQDDYNQILISDTIDVIFQEDIFKHSKTNTINFFEEETKETIGTSPHNSNWIKICYGEEELKKVYKKPILCTGTTLGDTKNILIYLQEFTKELYQIQRKDPHTFSKILDQGIHNYIIYNNKKIFNNPTIHKNGDIVATLAITIKHAPQKIKLEKDEILYNNKKCAIVHQYVRDKKLKHHFDDLYQK